MRILTAFLAAVLLAGCTVDRTALNATETALTAAETAATIYIQLPLCPQPSGRLCSDATVSANIKTADTLAYGQVVGMRSGKITVADAAASIAALVVLIPVKK